MREGENEREMYQKNNFNLNVIYIYLKRDFLKIFAYKKAENQGYFNVGSLKASASSFFPFVK